MSILSVMVLLVLILVIGLGFFLYKNFHDDQREVRDLLQQTQAEDEEQDKTSVL
jgi:hypothetical protein